MTTKTTGPSYCATCGEWPAMPTPNGLRCHLCECRDYAAAHPVPLPGHADMLRDLASIGVLGGRSVAMPYEQMKLDEIKSLPVGKLADENCDLYLWTTQKHLPVAFGVLDAWGFRYCQTLTWCKTPRGTGQGGLYCPTTEFMLVGRRGKMPNKPRVDTTWWNITRPHNCHSAKPEFFTDLIEAMGDAPRLELFARRNRLGWATWGNEALNHVELVTGNKRSQRSGGR